MQQSPLTREAKGRPQLLSGFSLKMIAILAMLVDHTAFLFVEDYYSPLGTVMHTIGRVTAPIMFYFIVEGYHHTRDKNRYTLRMALFALVSWLPFAWFYGGIRPFSRLPQGQEWLHLGVIYTLLLGLLALRVCHELRVPAPLKILLLVALFVLSLPGDWSYTALVCILLFDMFRGDFTKQAVAYAAVVVLRVMPTITTIYNMLASGNPGREIFRQLNQCAVGLGMLLPLALLYLYNGKKGGRGTFVEKWLFYLFYPLHLLVLSLLYTAR